MKKFLAVAVAFVFGCATTQTSQVSSKPETKEKKAEVNKVAAGAVIGAVVGGTIGAFTGPSNSNKGKRVLIGAATGAVVGGFIGYMLEEDAKRLEKELKTKPKESVEEPKISGKEVELVKEPSNIRVVLPYSYVFEKDCTFKEEGKEKLERIIRSIDPENRIIVITAYPPEGFECKNEPSKLARLVKKEFVKNNFRKERVITFTCNPVNALQILIYPTGITIPYPCRGEG